MPVFNPFVLGITLLLLGLAASALTFLLLRLVPQTQPSTRASSRPPIPLELAKHSEAVLLVQAGGKIFYLNPTAREWFNLWEEDPNLERLARRTRPSEAFLSLCAAEGQARFSLDNRFVDGTSYYIPYGMDRAMLVTLRRPQLIVGQKSAQMGEAQGKPSSQAFAIFTELSRSMAASLDLETTLKTILESVEQLISSDFSEITVWDSGENLLIPYRLIGLPGLDRHLEKSAERYQISTGYSGYLATQRQHLLVADVEKYHQVSPAPNRQQYPFHAYLGAPLVVAGDLVGTLELASLSKEAFNQNDLEILRVLAGQAAVALHNALLYQEEQRRALELAGLAQLAQAVSSLRDPKDLFAHLVESLTPLLNVEVLGFLVYDETNRTLEGQIPFMGLPSDATEWARTTIRPESPAEKVWLSQETILASDAPSDPRLQALELDHLALAAGIRQTVLAPLTSGGRGLGYLQVANKRDGSAFDQDDLRLLAIIAGQAAPIIENASLVQQSQRRAQRAETLRRIASLTGSTATLDEILKYSLQDLARLLQADKAAIFLLDEARGEMRLHKQSLFGVALEIANPFGRIPIDDPQFRHTVTGSQRPYASGKVAEDPRVLPLYRPLVAALQIQSAIVAPLIVRERGIGEVMIGSHQVEFFDRGDVQSVTTAAGQMASAVEQASLYSQTDESLRRRVDQLTALTRISRELNSTLDLQYLLQRVFDEVLLTTRADCGTILLFEIGEMFNERDTLPQIVLHLGDPPEPELHPLEQIVLEEGDSLVIQDFDHPLETDFTSGPALQPSPRLSGTFQPAHEGIHSALIVPIAYQEQVAGLIHLHAKGPHRFDETACEIAETLAVQAAIALGNAHRYQEQVRRSELLSRRVETLAKLFETSQTLQLEQPLEQALENIAYAIQSATPFDTVLISVYDPDSENMLRLTGAGLPLATLAELQAQPQSWNSLQKVLTQEFRTGHSYFIPYEQMPVMPTDIHAVRVLPWESEALDEEGRGSGESQSAWHPEDVLVVPLLNAFEQPLGMISVDAPRDGLRPDRPSIETLEIFGSQASLIIESQEKLRRLNLQIDEVQRDLQRARQTVQTSQSHLPALLHKDLEQTIAIQRLSQRARRIRAGMDIAEIVNRQADRSSALLALGREILTHMDLDAALVVEPGPRGPRLLHILGDIPAGINAEALLGQRNPLHYSLQNSETILVSRLDGHSPWSDSPLLHALETQGFVCLPILTSGKPNAAALAISRTPLSAFSSEDEQLFALLARQVAITLQNLDLLTETSRRLAEVNLLLDFSRQLGSLEPASILQALVESALHVVPAAQASLVAVWDPKSGLLVPQAASGYVNKSRLMEITYRSGEALPGEVFESQQPMRLDEVDFARHYNLSSENLLRYRDATDGKLPVSSLVVPIQKTHNSPPFGVLVLDNFTAAGAFTHEAQALITSLTQQTALNLENTRLYRAAEQRASQLQALTDVAATITSSLQPDDLIDTLLDQLETILPYETGTLWLRHKEKMLVRAARGFADSEDRLGLSVDVQDSQLLNEMTVTGLPISVGDVRQDDRFPAILEYQNFSWLGVPLIASGEVIGVIALEKIEPDFYTPEHIQAATTFAGQAAVALENANLYQESLGRARELNQRSKRLEMLNRLSSELSQSLDPSNLLSFTIKELAQAIPCSAVSAILFDSSGRAFVQAESPQMTRELPLFLPEMPLFDRLRESLSIFNTADVSRESELAPLADYLAVFSTHALLALSLATGSELHGILLAHADHPYRFTADEVGLARTISNQAAVAIQNARLYAETRSLTEDLDRRVRERTTELAREHQRTEILLRITTELSSSLDLEQVLNRTLKVLNEVVDAEQIAVLILRPGENKLYHLASVGYAPSPPAEGRASEFGPDQGLAGWVIKLRQPALIPDVREDPRWMQLPGSFSEHRSAIGVPLMIGAEALGALLFFHRQVDHFSIDQLDLIQAAANQVAVAVNNAELYRLIRDQAEDLGNMFRSQQIETSRSRAILEAVADGVLVTDSGRKITLFNASAEKILGLDRSRVIGKTLEGFTGLFGRAAQSWMETIHTWSQNPAAYQHSDVYTEQVILEDGRVVSVHLAPVSLRDDFLGTVSIFRDITHQVELDRLKSEFVATVSHELRTPMTSIKGYVEILLMGAAGKLSEQQAHFLEIVQHNTDRLTVLVNDLLDISRIESGRVTLSKQALDLSEVAREALDNLEHRSREEDKPMTMGLDRPSELPRAFGDLERVRHILGNLLDNAYNYTAAGGQITLRIQPLGDEIQVDVKDSGVGIPLDQQDRVFERFYRGEHPFVLATSGTGLGLSIVQHLVEMHGGRIWLESSGVPGEGSTFSFTLPVYNPEKSGEA